MYGSKAGWKIQSSSSSSKNASSNVLLVPTGTGFYTPGIDFGEERHVEVNVQVKENDSGVKHADVTVK